MFGFSLASVPWCGHSTACGIILSSQDAWVVSSFTVLFSAGDQIHDLTYAKQVPYQSSALFNICV